MSDSKSPAPPMENPYEKFGAHRNEVTGSPKTLVALATIFLALCVLPPLWRTVYDFGKPGLPALKQLFSYAGDEPLQQHLRKAEGRIEDESVIVKPIRQRVQGLLTATLREGNRKAILGDDGWLVFGPAIQSITGYGPLMPEPDTVAKDPNREPWDGPLEVIVGFGEQLRELDTELILVPIPVKPMILPEAIGASADLAPVTHPAATEFYAALDESEIEVIDLTPSMMAAKAAGIPVFLKQDTHWTPEMMRRAAKVVGDVLRERGLGTPAAAQVNPLSVSAIGDLVEKLDLPANGGFENEVAEITQYPTVDVNDLDSPVVLLGDSFTNIFHAENMSWGTAAGFAEHLAHQLGTSIDLIAQNGQASTGVRRELASRPDAVQAMKVKKKVVIWAIAERDLFLSETPARDNQVRWEAVTFRDTPADEFATGSEEFTFRGTMLHKSRVEDPSTAPYGSTVYSAVYQVDEVLSGDYTGEQVKVYHWGFIDRQLTEMAAYQEGGSYVVSATDMGRASADPALGLEGINRSDDTEGDAALMMDHFDLTAPNPGGDDTVAARNATIATSLAGLGFVGFGFWFGRRFQ